MAWYGGAEQYVVTANSASTTVAFTRSSKQLFIINQNTGGNVVYFSLDGGTVFAAVFPNSSIGPLDVSRPSIAVKANGAVTAAATASVQIVNITAP